MYDTSSLFTNSVNTAKWILNIHNWNIITYKTIKKFDNFKLVILLQNQLNQKFKLMVESIGIGLCFDTPLHTSVL